MALTYSSTYQDQIALAVHECLYTDLSPNQKKLIDNSSSSSPPGGVAGAAWIELTKWAQYISGLGGSTIPDEWASWFVAKAALYACRTMRPDRVRVCKQIELDARQTALTVLSRATFDYDPSSNTEATSTTYQTIRYHVLESTARRPKPIFISPLTVDACTTYWLNRLWNQYDWNFKRRQVTMKINLLSVTDLTYTESTKTLSGTGAFTDWTHVSGAMAMLVSGTEVNEGSLVELAGKTSANAVTLTSGLGSAVDGQTDIAAKLVSVTFPDLPAGETFDATAVRKYFYDLSYTTYGASLDWADPTDLARWRVGGTLAFDRPVVFRVQKPTGSRVNWLFSPWPDQSYTLRGEVYVTGPGTPSSATDTTVFAKFPPEFGPVIKDLVLAKCLKDVDADDGDRKYQEAIEQANQLLPIFAASGDSEGNFTVRDTYEDLNYKLRGPPWVGGEGLSGPM